MSAVRRMAHAVLAAAVRGRRDRGGDWGEAVLAEFPLVTGDWAAVRWAAGGLRAARYERRARVRELPRMVRIRRRAVLIALIGIVGGLLVNRFVVTVGYEPSGSMQPAYDIGDRYVLDRVAFRLTGVQRGDIVEFTMPGTDRLVIKRVIGLPGDEITCRDGQVWRNGRPLDESYLPADPGWSGTDCTPVTVPADQVYVLGDHRTVSFDSRQYGPISESALAGRVL
ncbi:Signal peptidase I T [Actinoplanes sp. SE50]|uniref:signal peptidase I n=1 Tax=unclassified Actinoplanes TaxID=2626549 RepID=UPI00023EBF3A|nr:MULTISPECIES: signal peptidase I [unclassified Actinoplanes]AEV85145.1 Signal peptidase I T [Actinoplanes sp. SE50/110]ATO83536.1 Signal peptidase I T [Actinoplanes sp. SE50]SLM00943.1 S26 family signal peptidase [Actinoplanes sp. SE50/110]